MQQKKVWDQGYLRNKKVYLYTYCFEKNDNIHVDKVVKLFNNFHCKD